ncbi:MAG TPA: right-handed parallel beta-helix repeat-containing protein [Gemmatimonadales bacterium]|jgi:plastocyanin
MRQVFGCLAIITLLGSCAGESRAGTFVTMIDNAFNATVTRVPVGARVIFMNVGGNLHNAMAHDSAWRTAGEIKPGGEETVVFDRAGIYPYYCTFHGTRDGKGMAGVIVVGDVAYTPGPKGAIPAVATASGITRRVPRDYLTIQGAVDAAAPGDLVLVDPGVYREEVTVTTPSLVLRGTDRNAVIIDGEYVRANGIAVLADAVAIENMTARNARLNGFYWSGVTGFRGSYLTAYNNGDYGIYAFGATDGVFEDSYASGSPDSGFYIGQCFPCHIVIRRVIAERNALGYSGTNSGGSLYVVSSIWRDNRSGLVPASLDIELQAPERKTVIAANLIVGNSNRGAPAWALPGIAFGNGVLIAGGVDNVVERNVIADHAQYGILVTPMLDKNFYRARGNIIRDNVVLGSGRGDLVLSGPLSSGNCFSGNRAAVAAPLGLTRFHGCDGLRLPVGFDPLPFTALVLVRGTAVQSARFPDWKAQPAPSPQPGMPNPLDAPVRPAMRVFDDLHFDLAKAELPLEALPLLKAQPHGGPNWVTRLANNATVLAMALILLLWLWLEFRIRERQAWLRWLFRVMGLAGAVVLYVLILAAVAIPFGRDF